MSSGWSNDPFQCLLSRSSWCGSRRCHPTGQARTGACHGRGQRVEARADDALGRGRGHRLPNRKHLRSRRAIRLHSRPMGDSFRPAECCPAHAQRAVFDGGRDHEDPPFDRLSWGPSGALCRARGSGCSRFRPTWRRRTAWPSSVIGANLRFALIARLHSVMCDKRSGGMAKGARWVRLSSLPERASLRAIRSTRSARVIR